jgi:lipopolysaccharide/colanic/teichoic acid biosynthesis glycosyltransferase
MKRETQMRLKRILDVALACSGLVICAPILALAGVAIKLDSAGPVLFRLRAAGVNGEMFLQWKVRTMVDGARNVVERSADNESWEIFAALEY